MNEPRNPEVFVEKLNAKEAGFTLEERVMRYGTCPYCGTPRMVRAEIRDGVPYIELICPEWASEVG